MAAVHTLSMRGTVSSGASSSLQAPRRNKDSRHCNTTSYSPLLRSGRGRFRPDEGIRVEEDRWARVLCRAKKKQYGSFDEMVQESEKPILVDFNATWCGPCRIMSDVLVNLRKDDAVKSAVDFVKVDTDKYPAICTRYGVSALPTLVLFIDGMEVDRFQGLMSEYDLKQRLMYFILSRQSQQS